MHHWINPAGQAVLDDGQRCLTFVLGYGHLSPLFLTQSQLESMFTWCNRWNDGNYIINASMHQVLMAAMQDRPLPWEV